MLNVAMNTKRLRLAVKLENTMTVAWSISHDEFG
jgi:hypothetical protein